MEQQPQTLYLTSLPPTPKTNVPEIPNQSEASLNQPKQNGQQESQPLQSSQQASPLVDVSEFLNDIHSPAAYSADTVVNSESGAVHIEPTLPESVGIAGGKEKMSDSEAASHTRTLMDMRETGQSMFIAYVADGKVTEHKDYVYERWQKELLIEAYTPLVQQSGIKVNPWLKVAYAEAVSSGPLVALMLKNRNNRITIEQQARKIAELNRKLAEKGEEPVKQLERKDTVRGWKINAKGEFTHSKDGEYIKDGNPREKAVLTAENYPYFVKYNSKELVHRVFNIPK